MDARERAMNLLISIFYATVTLYVLCKPKTRDRAERIPASSDSESPSERASKRPRTRSRKQHRVAKSTPTRNDDDITRLLEGFKNALQDFNRNASGSETADEARRLHGRVNEVKIVVRALKRNWEAKKLGDGRVPEEQGAAPTAQRRSTVQQPSTPRSTRPKKRLRVTDEKEEGEKEEEDLIEMLVEGLREVARILGQNVNAPSGLDEVLDDLQIDIEELGIDVKEVLAKAGHSPKDSGVDWLDSLNVRNSGDERGKQLNDAVKS